MATYTRQDFIEYCLRKLGKGVIDINVTPEQIEDRIDEALEYFRIYHFDGIEKVYLKHKITQEDTENKYITVPDLIYGITKVYPISAGTSISKSFFDLQYQLRLNDLYDLTSTSIIYFQQAMSHIALLDNVLNGQQLFRFNRLNNRLYIDATWEYSIPIDTYILVECYRVLDPNDVPKLWNDSWLKHYATALIKKQWGNNMKKFQGLQLPGGITVDGESIYQEASQEIKDLEEELFEKSPPTAIFIG